MAALRERIECSEPVFNLEILLNTAVDKIAAENVKAEVIATLSN
ncbi:hypothetical protein CPTD_02092 [Corynebacterium pseudotuberculosis]|nr:Hypothetical protein Cp4202_1872 [Corynebacterium pseudotuberculosis 42/02-A]AIG06094.1 hypothetical protein CPTA_00265 [Corynebacterium pseudotuberculosis]AIG09321.1 hypothetical protein CPTB_01265 [Corynebacterium pseudotuberculosis]AIG11221.1 hypothetical protein CPTC_00933 [Corynebacterium pseudotuberculosis]AKC74644.1 Hypothetical protein Cp226_1954 [Corynebacterium pseudotuberculosis]